MRAVTVVVALAAVGVSALRPHVRLPTARRGTRSFAAPIPVALTVARSFEAVDVEAALCNVSAVVDIGAEVEVIMPVTVERCVPFVGCAQVPTGAFETSVTTISAAIAVRPGCVNLTGVAHDSRLRSELDGGGSTQ